LRPARLATEAPFGAVNLRTQLTLAFLLLTLVPSAVIGVIAVRQVLEVNAIWESAGFDQQMDSSVNVAVRTLERMRYDLDNAAGPLVNRWIDELPDLSPDSPEREYILRYLEDVGFDFVMIYAPTDTGLVLVSEVHPDHSEHHADLLGTEVEEHDPDEGPLESMSGAYAYVRDIANGHRVAVGYSLGENFFADLFEIRLGRSMWQQVVDYKQLRLNFSMVLIASLLTAAVVLAIFGGAYLSRRMAGPVTELSEQLDTMAPGPTLHEISEPRPASPEVQALTSAFNSLTDRLRATQLELLRTERVAGSATVARHVAHEIKNPLSTLGLATRRLERRLETLPEEERAVAGESLAAMRKEFEILEDMAETFSELGRMAQPLKLARFDLNQMTRSVCALYGQGTVRVELDLDPGLTDIQGDERSLRRMVANLLKNAIEAQSGGGQVTIRTRSRGSRISLEVEDEGHGIPEEIRAQVFEPGFSTKRRGSGVGLFLARTIVEQHGGSIDIQSESGKGTLVRVELPALGEGGSVT
jgi:nitrogen fixation/metabolism regulation signal transduction histidine kinase